MRKRGNYESETGGRLVKGDHTFDCRDGTGVLRAGGAVYGMGHGSDVSGLRGAPYPGDSLWLGHCSVLLCDSLSVLEGLRADRTRQFFFQRECKVVCGNQQAGVCAGGGLVCRNSVPRGKAGAWTGISDFYDSAHFYQCGDRGACGGAVPSDLQVV